MSQNPPIDPRVTIGHVHVEVVDRPPRHSTGLCHRATLYPVRTAMPGARRRS